MLGLGAAVYVVWHKAAEAGPADALKDFAAAWSRGDDAAAGELTERPPVATAALRANRKGLDGARVTAVPGPVEERGGTARATLRVTWDVPAIGRYSYRTNAALAHREEGWRVVWQPTLVHPRLDEDSRLGTVSRPARRGASLRATARRSSGCAASCASESSTRRCSSPPPRRRRWRASWT